MTTLDYARDSMKSRVSARVALIGVIVSAACAVGGIWLTLRVTPIMIEWPGHNSVRYQQYSDQFYFLALPLCAAPLAGWYLAWRANVHVVSCRVLVCATALVWLACWFHVR